MPTSDEYKELYSKVYFTHSGARPMHASIEGRKLRYFAARIERICLHLKRKPATLLDIGAATGACVKAALQEGIAADGIELSTWACAEAEKLHGIKLFEGDLLESNLPLRGNYDVVVMNQSYCQKLCMGLSCGGAILAFSVDEFDAANDLGELI